MNPRYEFLRALGRGGQGEVQLVRDLGREGCEVALKRVARGSQADALRREFSVLRSLRHPSLARAYDFGCDDEGCYFTSEYVEGSDLFTWARRDPLPAVVRGLASVLRGVALLHSRGLVHGDLSPANVLVPSGVEALPKILDLGSARQPGEPAVAATPGFAAPEIYTGRGLLFQSDLYSLGAILSQCLLGVPAFGSGDAAQIVERQLRGDLDLPSSDTSPLVRLCRELLSLDPSARPANALTVIERLSTATEIELSVTLKDLRDVPLPGPALCGRDDELQTLVAAIEHLDETDRPRVIGITGPLGSGRSTLLEAAISRAQLEGLTVVGSCGAPLTVERLVCELLSLPFCQNTTADRSREQLAAVTQAGHGVLEPERLCLAVVDVLTTVSRSRPVLLVLDDLDQASALLRRVASTLARALDPERLGDRPAALMTAAWKADSRVDLPSAQMIALPPLTRAAADAAVRSMLPGVEVTAQLLDTVWMLSNGSPAEIEALVLSAARRGGDLSELSSGLLSSLSSSERASLRVLWAVDAAVPSRIVRKILGEEETRRLVSQGLLVEGLATDGLTLRVTGAAVGHLGTRDAETESLAARFANELMDHGNRVGAARLYAFCDKKEAAVLAYVDAATQAAERGDVLASAGAYDAALELDRDSVADWLTQAVEIYRRLGRHADALEICHRMPISETERLIARVELLLDGGRHAQAWELAEKSLGSGEASLALRAAGAAALVHLGHHEDALALAAGGIEAASGRRTDVAVGRLSLVSALACLSLGRLEQASKHLSLASRAFEECSDTLGQLKVVAAMGQLAWRRSAYTEARSAFERAIHLAQELGDGGRQALYTCSRASMAQIQDDYVGALSDYRAALDMATLLGNEPLRASVEANLADLLAELGQTREAEKLALRAAERARATGQPRCERQALLVRGKARLFGGDLVRAEAALNEARRRFAGAGEEAFSIAAQIRLAQVELSRGNAPAALHLAANARQQAELRGFKKERAKALVVEACSTLGAGQSAHRALELFETAAADILGEDERWRLEWHMAKAFHADGQKERAIEAKARARIGLSKMLARIPEDMRGSFLGYGEAKELEPSGRVDIAISATDRWARDLEMLMDITLELTRERDPKRLLSLIMERAVEITGAERGMVILPRGGKLEPVVAHQIDEDVEVSFSRSVAEKVVAEGRPTLAVDALDDDRFRAFASVNTMKLRSILAVPLAIRRKVVGVIYLDSRLRSGVFGEADRRLLEAFGAQAAVALETARLMSERDRRMEELERANAEVLSLSRQLEEKLERKESDLRRVGALLKQTGSEESGIIGRSSAMQTLLRLVERVASADVSIYIYGPSGTGKELVARAIHARSERSLEPFVAVNCGALPDSLLASELFGHMKGAFTGATRDRKGLFEIAHGGTLLLDEVGDMGPDMQAHLLRVLQDCRFRRLGSNEEIIVNVRVLCASNKDLAAEVASGRFREDLFYRLNVVRIDVPPLTERRDDIPLLVEHFLRKHAGKDGVKPLSREALELLLCAEWPGNVRELENEVQRAIAMSTRDEPIRPQDLSPRLQRSGRDSAALPIGKGLLKDRVDAFEKVVIERVLEECRGNATQAAKNLGLSRAGLYKKLGKHHVVR